MKKHNYKFWLLAFLFLTISGSAVWAQDDVERLNDAPNSRPARRPNLLSELDLTPDQIRQIRRINADKKPQIRDAQQKMREANRNLDQAIYADSVDESEIQTRLKAVQTAQAEISKMRAMTEYAVRKVLTPEQLVRFREIRQSFMEQKEGFKVERKNRRSNLPNQKIFNRQRRQRANY